MRIAIAAPGRFHVLDLARELERLGEDVAFYSYVPRARAEKFGLPRRCHRSLLPAVAPLVAWQAYLPRTAPQLLEKAMAHALDRAVMTRLAPCEHFICMSGIYLEAARTAKRRYGARIWLERGSRHILSQAAILKDLGAAQGPSPFIIERELEGYDLADRIAVPSTHVADSFAEHSPQLVAKLFVNPYGTDLSQFPLRTLPPPVEPKTVIFVGGWSYRKGADILIEAIRSLDGVRLLHVGALAGAPFPFDDPRFEHVDPVPQWRLKDYYARAHVFALASREEGLAVVQAQALASGLPLVCTARTGGADLALAPSLARRISVVPPDDATAFAAALQKALIGEFGSGQASNLPAADLALLSWEAYARRYLAALGSGKAQRGPVARAAMPRHAPH